MKTWIAALVVEDDALVRFDLAQTLEAEGYKTFEAADAAEAIAVLEAHSEITVVFTDIQMPGTMDGLALSHYVRKRWPPTIIDDHSSEFWPLLPEFGRNAERCSFHGETIRSPGVVQGLG